MNILFSWAWILVTEICLETENIFKFDSLELEACKGKKATVGLAG